MKKKKIGIVGCGAIGTNLATILHERFSKDFCLAALCDMEEGKAHALMRRIGEGKVLALKELIRASDLVVEAASAQVSFGVAQKALTAKKDVLIMSIGGVLGREKELFSLARKNNATVYFPSGAICGLDGIRALALAGLTSITLRTYKPPRALEGADYIKEHKIVLADIREETVIFRGTAFEAVRAFPQNINVVALLTLAAQGQVVPQVEILASPKLSKNVHVIDVRSEAADLQIRCENVPSPQNPKTSYLAILSAAATIAGMKDVVRIG